MDAVKKKIKKNKTKTKTNKKKKENKSQPDNSLPCTSSSLILF
jgi:hypothetical protein